MTEYSNYEISQFYIPHQKSIELINNTNQAVERGAFGVPTFFINDEMFFGKESLREIKDLVSS